MDKYKFTESYRATQESLTAKDAKTDNCVRRCCHWLSMCGSFGFRDSSKMEDEQNGNVTANNMLLNEIDNLKRSLQEVRTA